MASVTFDRYPQMSQPAGVKTPLGPLSEIIRAWHMRMALWRESTNFLGGDDVAPVPS
jgi:hypothetical protein